MDSQRAFELLSCPVGTSCGPRAGGDIDIISTDFKVQKSNPRMKEIIKGGYSFIYQDRLHATKGILEDKIKVNWPTLVIKNIRELCVYSTVTTRKVTKTKLFSVHDSKPSSDSSSRVYCYDQKTNVVLIGTVAKMQPKKPSIVTAVQGCYTEQDTWAGVIDKWTSDDDYLLLEDPTGSVRLNLNINCGLVVGKAVNGIVIGVQGNSCSDGSFNVKGVIYPTPRNCVWPTVLCSQTEMIFISGLRFGNTDVEHRNRTEILFEYLSGIVGSPMEQKEILLHRNRIFFVGDLFEPGCAFESKTIHALDLMFSELAQNVDVYIIAGENDPVRTVFPQPPIHRIIFPISSQLSTFHSLANPSRFTVNVQPTEEGIVSKLDIILTSGQNIKDGLRNSTETESLRMSINTLKWGNLCPTAPDTLPLNTDAMSDVCIVDSLPNMYIIGNQSKYDQVGYRNTRIVNLPSFSESGMAVIFDKNMRIVPLYFNVFL